MIEFQYQSGDMVNAVSVEESRVARVEKRRMSDTDPVEVTVAVDLGGDAPFDYVVLADTGESPDDTYQRVLAAVDGAGTSVDVGDVTVPPTDSAAVVQAIRECVWTNWNRLTDYPDRDAASGAIDNVAQETYQCLSRRGDLT